MRLTLLFILFSNVVIAQSTGFDYSEQLSGDSIRSYLSVLASDSLEGRETGRLGQKKAASFLESFYKNLNLITRAQKHPLNAHANSGFNLVINNSYFVYYQDFYYAPFKFDSLYIGDEVLVSGFGINQNNYHDFADGDLTSKNVLVSWTKPMWKKRFRHASGTPQQFATLTEFVSSIISQKPKMIFIDVDSIPLIISQIENDPQLLGYLSSITIPVIFINRNTTEKFFPSETQLLYTDYLLRIQKKQKANSYSFKGDVYLKLVKNNEKLLGENIIAYMEGSSQKKECLVISSHYDHLGIKDSLIYPGADDNGSGTSAIMEMARIFSKAKLAGQSPERSIIFLNVSGEEKGLLGSTFYVKHPFVELKNTIADLNIDMIGRTDERHDSLKENNYIYIIGANRLSNDLAAINTEMNSKYIHLNLDYTYDLDGDPNRFYQRSDHYNFAKNNVPIIFYFNGVHADYHQPTDRLDKIDINLIRKRASLVFLTAWELVNRKERIKMNNQ